MTNPPQPERHSVNLHLLTPLHIGTGQEVDPFSYVIKDNRVHFIDLIRWMDAFPNRKLLEDVMASNSFEEVRTFIAQNISAADYTRAVVPIDCAELSRIYQLAIEKRDSENQVFISPTIRNELSMEPFLPGSSLKGAIRTALANAFRKEAGVTSADAMRIKDKQPPYKYLPDYNEKIFGTIKADPMKWLKVPDIPFDKGSSVIMEAKELSLDVAKSSTPKGFVEVLKGLSYTKTPVSETARISFAPFRLSGKTVDIAFLIDALSSFYVPKYREELEKFYGTSGAAEVGKILETVTEIIKNLKTNEAIVRVGHYSHVECVTLDDVRQPITRKDKEGKPIPWGTTRTLANGFHPFGWIKLEFPDIPGKSHPNPFWNIPISSAEKPSDNSVLHARKHEGDSKANVKASLTDLAKLKEKFSGKK